jgi:uronate dehydrogenase
MNEILLTGAGGRIGSALVARLPGYGWTVRAFDRVDAPGGLVGDLGSPADLDRVMDGVDAVVHLAGLASEAPWPQLRDANVDGLLNVFEAARRADVRRVIWASSNHATGFTPVTADLPADAPVRPDTLYGVTKAFGEALARYYVDRYGMQMACLRIGTFADRPPDVRALSTWLSPDDCARLVDACLRSPALTYAIVWGASANTRRTWTLAEGAALGYRPRDDAESYAAELPNPQPDPSDRLVGGGFTGPGFGIDEVLARS